MQTCGVCHAVKPRVKELAKEYKIPVEEIDATLHPEVASRYEVLTVPAVLLMVGDKEFARQARFIDLLELEKRIVQAKAYVEAEETEWKPWKNVCYQETYIFRLLQKG